MLDLMKNMGHVRLRAIQEKIEDLISEEVLRGTITEDKPFVLDMKDEEELIVKKGN